MRVQSRDGPDRCVRCAAPVLALPDPPPTLPPAARAFYDALRAVVAEVRPTELDADRVEVAFGDGGVAVTLPHVREEDWTVAAQVGRRSAVVFAGPVSAHFDERAGDGWTGPAVDLVTRALRGQLDVELVFRGDRLVRVGGERLWSAAALARWRPSRRERIRIDFGGRAG